MGLKGLFLGAGASFELGMPLVWELTAFLKGRVTPKELRRMNHRARAMGSGYADEVVDRTIQLLARADLHYEAILGNLETEYIRRGGHGVAQNYAGMRSWLVQMVYIILANRHLRDFGFIQSGLPFYRGLGDLAAANQPLWVFSLNHDVLIECIAAELSLPISSGFTGTATLPRRDNGGNHIGDLSAETLLAAELAAYPSMRFLPAGQFGINLLKVHGAIDIFTFNNGDDLLKVRPVGSGAKGVVSAIHAVNEELLVYEQNAPGRRWNVTNEIAYTDHIGVPQFLRRSLLTGAHKFTKKSTQVLPHQILACMEYYLGRVEHLVCIGYSFGDIHVNQGLRDWLELLPARRLEIVDPAAHAVPEFIRHLSPQVDLVRSGATEYFDRCAKQPLTWFERQLRDGRSYLRKRGTQLPKWLTLRSRPAGS